jgi:hypothetical protein
MQIILRQLSGLGNQLFQYAAGLYFARRYNASLRISTARDTLSHGLYPRPFLLDRFHIEATVQPASPLERILFSTRPTLQPFLPALERALHIARINEPQLHTFLPDLPLPPETRTLFLTGYFQAHRFAQANEQELRRQLTFRAPATGQNLALQQQIAQAPNPVSLHIRRGDYALPQQNFYVLPPTWYANAIAYLRTHTPDPTFFVFSDEIAYARSILPTQLPAVFVDHNNDATAQEDLRLIASCRHHILANSSFSWWGAWLNPRPDKIVYAPHLWGRNPGHSFPELLPPTWIVVP